MRNVYTECYKFRLVENRLTDRTVFYLYFVKLFRFYHNWNYISLEGQFPYMYYIECKIPRLMRMKKHFCAKIDFILKT